MKKYYVYQIVNKETGEFYIGSRGCKCEISEDNYTGSPHTWKKPNSEDIKKIILKSGFLNMEETIMYERELILANIKNPLNRNYSIPHPKLSREGLVTAKDEISGKIISVYIEDPLLKSSLVGVTKGKVVVRDERGNTFMTETTNPDYVSGKLKHANIGLVSGESHPNYGKQWVNNGEIQKLINFKQIENYLSNGWNTGTLQKGVTTNSSHLGTCWIHNLEKQKTKRIDKSQLEEYLSIGWLPNRLKLGKYGKREK